MTAGGGGRVRLPRVQVHGRFPLSQVEATCQRCTLRSRQARQHLSVHSPQGTAALLWRRPPPPPPHPLSARHALRRPASPLARTCPNAVCPPGDPPAPEPQRTRHAASPGGARPSQTLPPPPPPKQPWDNYTLPVFQNSFRSSFFLFVGETPPLLLPDQKPGRGRHPEGGEAVWKSLFL
jgi:U5 snRNP spliceosome subunit